MARPMGMTARRSPITKLLLLSVTPLVLLAACSDETPVRAADTTPSSPADGGSAGDGTVPARPADITGTVTSVSPFEPITEDCTPPDALDPDGVVSSDDPPVCTPDDNDVLGTVLVEQHPDLEEGRKISFAVTTDTVLTGLRLGSFDDLAEGMSVEAWATGPCAESYPEQCSAAAIRASAT